MKSNMTCNIKLDWSKWNNYVGDTAQCAKLPHDEEVKFLSSKDPARELSRSIAVFKGARVARQPKTMY